jgi:hypothetical protein
MFVFEQSHGCSSDAERNEIVLIFCFGDYAQNFARLLIEGLDRCPDVSIGEAQRLAQHSLSAVLIDVEAENLSAKFAVYRDVIWPGRGLRFILRETQGRGDAEQSKNSKKDHTGPDIISRYLHANFLSWRGMRK